MISGLDVSLKHSRSQMGISDLAEGHRSDRCVLSEPTFLGDGAVNVVTAPTSLEQSAFSWLQLGVLVAFSVHHRAKDTYLCPLFMDEETKAPEVQSLVHDFAVNSNGTGTYTQACL